MTETGWLFLNFSLYIKGKYCNSEFKLSFEKVGIPAIVCRRNTFPNLYVKESVCETEA